METRRQPTCGEGRRATPPSRGYTRPAVPVALLPPPVKDPAAVELGRRGGLIGGKARAAKLTPERRSEIARNAAAKRWGLNRP